MGTGVTTVGKNRNVANGDVKESGITGLCGPGVLESNTFKHGGIGDSKCHLELGNFYTLPGLCLVLHIHAVGVENINTCEPQHHWANREANVQLDTL